MTTAIAQIALFFHHISCHKIKERIKHTPSIWSIHTTDKQKSQIQWHQQQFSKDGLQSYYASVSLLWHSWHHQFLPTSDRHISAKQEFSPARVVRDLPARVLSLSHRPSHPRPVKAEREVRDPSPARAQV